MKIDFNAMTRRFLMGEGRKDISPNALIQALTETLSTLRPSSRKDENKIAIAQNHLREITRSFRKLQEQVNLLEEQLSVLEEASSMGGGNVQGAMLNAVEGGPFPGLDVEKENDKEKKRSKRK